MTALTSLAGPKTAIQVPDQNQQLTVTVSGNDDGDATNESVDEITLRVVQRDLVITGATSNSPILRAVDAIRLGQMTPPADLRSLLTQAVAVREARSGEDIESWSQRLADEAARADS